MPRALITGITGQDGRYLAELLIGKGYQVHGMIRGQNNPKGRIVQDEIPEIELINGDLTDLSSLIAAVEQVQPDEVYNLGAISFVKLSFSQPELTADVSGTGVLRLLEAIRIVGGPNNRIRFYQAATSEMFGKVHEIPQSETTPFHPSARLWDGESVRLLHDAQLPRILRNPRLERHSLQSHQPSSGPGVRRAQNHQCRSQDLTGPSGDGRAGKPGHVTGLRVCGRLRRSDVENAPAGRSQRLRRGDGDTMVDPTGSRFGLSSHWH